MSSSLRLLPIWVSALLLLPLYNVTESKYITYDSEGGRVSADTPLSNLKSSAELHNLIHSILANESRYHLEREHARHLNDRSNASRRISLAELCAERERHEDKSILVSHVAIILLYLLLAGPILISLLCCLDGDQSVRSDLFTVPGYAQKLLDEVDPYAVIQVEDLVYVIKPKATKKKESKKDNNEMVEKQQQKFLDEQKSPCGQRAKSQSKVVAHRLQKSVEPQWKHEAFGECCW